MIVIIDGYNLLHAIFPIKKGKADGHREHFVRQLSHYKEARLQTIDDVIIVFDAGPFGHAVREVHNGVVVVYSGQKSNADEWMVEFCERHRGKEMVVVTKDRQLIVRCKPFGAESLGVEEFYGLMRAATLESDHEGGYELASDVKKFDHEDDDQFPGGNRRAVDMLMEEATIGLKPKHESHEPTGPRKSTSRVASKDERKLLKTLKKL